MNPENLPTTHPIEDTGEERWCRWQAIGITLSNVLWRGGEEGRRRWRRARKYAGRCRAGEAARLCVREATLHAMPELCRAAV